jgi:hypothetical protein
MAYIHEICKRQSEGEGDLDMFGAETIIGTENVGRALDYDEIYIWM